MVKNEVSELDYFSNLNSKDIVVRLNAARGIVKRLKAESRTNSHNVYLICKRLIRGLGGGNGTFRQGCFSSLVGYLSLVPPGFDITAFEKIIESELHPAGSNTKQEKGEAYLGQILAYGSMITTNLIFSSPEEVQKTIFDKLFQLSRQRSYLHHVSFVYMNEFLKKSEKEFIPDGFLDDIRNLNDNPLDKLNYLLTLNGKSFKTSTIKKALGTKSFFDQSNVSKMIDFLKKSKSSVMLGHSFIEEFASSICSHPDFFLLFWSTLTHQKHLKNNTTDLIKPSSSDDTVTLELCRHLLKACSKHGNLELTKSLWSKSFTSLLLQNVKKNKKIVQAILNEFCTCIKPADDEVKLSILKLTLFDLGVLNFDVLTGSKTILTITNNLSFNGLKQLARSYKAIIENKNEIIGLDGKNRSILICLNYYTKLINSPACYEKTLWRLKQLIYLMKLGFFKQSDVHLNRELINHVQEAFLASLGHRFPNMESFQKVLNGLFLELNNLLDKQREDMIIQFTDEMFEAWKKSFSLNDQMTKFIENESREVIIILKIVLHYMSLLILKEASTAIINIQDLNNIFLEITEGSETMWIEVLTDLFLNLLSKPNYHHRHLIRCIFKSLCPHLTLESFNQIVEVLELSYDPRNLLEQDINDKSDESESEADSDNSDDDSEVDDDDDNDAEDNENDDGDEITPNEKLRFELRNVLTGESDVESIDLDNMDEEEGKRLNQSLGNIFKSNMKRKSGSRFSKYQNQLAHFRIRVIDLIEICTEVPLPFSYWLCAAIPLIDLYGSTVGQKQLDNLKSRINCCIKKLNSSKVTLENDCVKETVTVLNELFKKISKSTGVYSDMKTELSSMIRFILKSSKPFSKGLKEKQLAKNEIFQIFKKHLEDFFHGKNNIPATLFNSMISIGWDGILALIPILMHFIFDDDLKIHKRVLGIKMIEIFIKTPQFFDGHLENYYKLYLTNSAEIFYASFTDALEKVCVGKDLNAKLFSELWSLLFVILNKQAHNSAFPQTISNEKVKDLLSTKYQDLPIMKGQCKQNFKKLCNFLKITNNVTNSKETNSPKSDAKEGSEKKNINKRKKKGTFQGGIKKKAKKGVVSSN